MTATVRSGWLLLVCAFAWTVAAVSVAGAAEFYVSSHGWHTGIIVPRAAVVACGGWPPGVAERDFAGCEDLELVWGYR